MKGRIALFCLFVALFAALILGAGRARAEETPWTSEEPIARTTNDGSWAS